LEGRKYQPASWPANSSTAPSGTWSNDYSDLNISHGPHNVSASGIGSVALHKPNIASRGFLSQVIAKADPVDNHRGTMAGFWQSFTGIGSQLDPSEISHPLPGAQSNHRPPFPELTDVAEGLEGRDLTRSQFNDASLSSINGSSLQRQELPKFVLLSANDYHPSVYLQNQVASHDDQVSHETVTLETATPKTAERNIVLRPMNISKREASLLQAISSPNSMLISSSTLVHTSKTIPRPLPSPIQQPIPGLPEFTARLEEPRGARYVTSETYSVHKMNGEQLQKLVSRGHFHKISRLLTLLVAPYKVRYARDS
jgi:hypothetical protein